MKIWAANLLKTQKHSYRKQFPALVWKITIIWELLGVDYFGVDQIGTNPGDLCVMCGNLWQESIDFLIDFHQLIDWCFYALFPMIINQQKDQKD